MQTQLQSELSRITRWLGQQLDEQKVESVVLAVSGGIDSAVCLALLTRVLEPTQIHAALLPYGKQNMVDARLVCQWHHLPLSLIHELPITKSVDQIASSLKIPSSDHLRRGNVMARVRMIHVYDLAKANGALVVGTENRSEKYLGYFTRFGDAASDIEPISHLYKTEVFSLAKELELPHQLITKKPSAELWQGQSDESELGFSYAEADQVLHQLIDLKKSANSIRVPGIPDQLIKKICSRVTHNEFKQQVPYKMTRRRAKNLIV